MTPERDELLEFLKHFHVIYPNLNDTFHYACADSQRISLDIDAPFGPDEDGDTSNGEVLVQTWRQYGYAGIVAYVARIRGQEPIPPIRTDDYQKAREALKDWAYEPD